MAFLCCGTLSKSLTLSDLVSSSIKASRTRNNIPNLRAGKIAQSSFVHFQNILRAVANFFITPYLKYTGLIFFQFPHYHRCRRLVLWVKATDSLLFSVNDWSPLDGYPTDPSSASEGCDEGPARPASPAATVSPFLLSWTLCLLSQLAACEHSSWPHFPFPSLFFSHSSLAASSSSSLSASFLWERWWGCGGEWLISACFFFFMRHIKQPGEGSEADVIYHPDSTHDSPEVPGRLPMACGLKLGFPGRLSSSPAAARHWPPPCPQTHLFSAHLASPVLPASCGTFSLDFSSPSFLRDGQPPILLLGSIFLEPGTHHLARAVPVYPS